MYRLFDKSWLLVPVLVLVGCSSSPSKQHAPAKSTSTTASEKTASAEKAGAEKTSPPEKSEKSKSSKPSKNDDAAIAATNAPPEPPPIPAEVSQRFEKALSLMGSGDLLQAESELQRLSAAYPSYSGPLANLGVIYLKSGRFADAEKALAAATKLNPQNAAAFNQLGIVYRNLGRFKEADLAYTSALSADSGYALAYLNLGVLCDLYLQQPKRALEAFERYQSLATKPDQKVDTWVKELRTRLGIKTPAAPKVEADHETSSAAPNAPNDAQAAATPRAQ